MGAILLPQSFVRLPALRQPRRPARARNAIDPIET
jgi:hypothetical protein